MRTDLPHVSGISRRTLLQLLPLLSAAGMQAVSASPGVGSAKKGLGITTKTKDWAAKVRSLKCKWFYSWGSEIPDGIPEGVDFKPMIWGYWGNRAAIAQAGKDAKAAGIQELLGFNEPDQEHQANLSVEKVLDVWPLLMETGLRLGSPGCVHPDREWMKGFMDGVKKRGLRVDFVCVHSYGDPSVEGFIRRLTEVQKMFNKPLWITEFAVGDWEAKNAAQIRYRPPAVLKFMETALPRLNKLDFVERYAWFPAPLDMTNLGTSALFDDDGKLTRLGECYRDA